MNSAKFRRKERKLKKYAAELFLSGCLTTEETELKMDETLIRQKIRAKRKRESIAKIYFKPDHDYRRPVSSTQLQNLIVSSVLTSQTPVKPDFCQIINWRSLSQTIFVVVDCDLLSKNINEDEFWFFSQIPYVSSNFLHRFYVDFDDGHDFYSNFYRTPISLLDRIKSVENHNQEDLTENNETFDNNNLKCGKTNYLMTLCDMAQDNYPLPDEKNPRIGFLYSLSSYFTVTDESPVFALDCEMCMTGTNARELTRISIVDEQYNVVLDTLVKPKNRITDYLTRFSGITEKMLSGTVTSLSDVQSFLKTTLPGDAILCGHSLNCDLDCLGLFHPYTIDVSILYNLSGNRKSRSSLKTLTHLFLGETIQNSPKGHCSVEDAYATMKLFKLKFSNGIKFGNVQLGWNYNKYAKNNDINAISGLRKKRKFEDSEEEIEEPCKKFKKDITATATSCKIFNCNSCGNQLQANCRNEDCMCRNLLHTNCFNCLKKVSPGSNKVSPADNVISCEEKIEEISAEKIFAIPPSGPSELLFDLFQRKKKSILWITNENNNTANEEFKDLCKLADVATCCLKSTVADNDECLKIFKSNQFEKDLNVLEFNYSQKNYQEFNTVAEEILLHSARNSFICFMFKQNAKAICCMKVKH